MDSVFAQSHPSVETIVIDNASQDGSADACQRRHPSLRMIRSPKNLGFAGGCNLGVRSTTGDVVLLLNPDAIAAADLVEVMVERLTADRTIGVLGAKIYDPDWKTLQHAGGELLPNALSSHTGRGEEDTGQYDQPRDCPYVTGAAFAVRRAVLQEVGLLDPWYVPAYYEEVDLCFRIARRGYRIVYEPRARVAHHEGVSSGKLSDRFFYLYHRNRLRFVLRQFGKIQLFRDFLPFELHWMRRLLPPDQVRPLTQAYLTNLVRAPLTLLGY